MFEAKTFEKNNKSVSIELVDEEFVAQFYNNNELVGIISYTNKSWSYVTSAAENWLNDILTESTVRRYSNY